ncbi:MAG: hypothetical protein AB8B85_23540 [Paracoccaceae bacterium]
MTIAEIILADGQARRMVGLLPRVPTFVKRYGTTKEVMQATVGQYADEVQAKTFPGDEHTYRKK